MRPGVRPRRPRRAAPGSPLAFSTRGGAKSTVDPSAAALRVATDVVAGGTRNENEEGLEEIRIGWKGLDRLAAEIEGLGRRILTLTGDVSRADDAERMVADALRQFGKIDVLVNNAAAPHGADRRLLWEVPEEAWDAILDVNLKGVYLMCRAPRIAPSAARVADALADVARRYLSIPPR